MKYWLKESGYDQIQREWVRDEKEKATTEERSKAFHLYITRNKWLENLKLYYSIGML